MAQPNPDLTPAQPTAEQIGPDLHLVLSAEELAALPIRDQEAHAQRAARMISHATMTLGALSESAIETGLADDGLEDHARDAVMAMLPQGFSERIIARIHGLHEQTDGLTSQRPTVTEDPYERNARLLERKFTPEESAKAQAILDAHRARK